MSNESMWDAYGQWDQFAKLDKIEDVKSAITGNPVWRPNFVPPALAYVFDYINDEVRASTASMVPTVVDFGCGLGRNGPMLRRFFPRVVGVDLPEMIERLRTEFPDLVEKTYGNLYCSVDSLAEAEDPSTVYDSVVFQHIVDSAYVSQVIDSLSSKSCFRTFVSVYYGAGMTSPHLSVLQEKGWRIWHSEVDQVSFEGVPHSVTIFRR